MSNRNMKIAIWNINGIESKSMDALLRIRANIVCFSETKIGSLTHYPVIPELETAYPFVYPHLCQSRLRYSGTCVYSRECALRRIPTPDFDTEGRIIGLEYEDFVLIHVYTPNSGRKGARLSYRVQFWDPLFWSFVKQNRVPQKKIIVCGDLNVVPTDMCIWRPNPRAAGCTVEERSSFWRFVTEQKLKLAYLPDDESESDAKDTKEQYEKEIDENDTEKDDNEKDDAEKEKEKEAQDTRLYSFWSGYSNCREQNKGWLLDHFVVSENFPIKSYTFYTDIYGSDHCPVALEF
jgi:exodeoxyribonuclease-3